MSGNEQNSTPIKNRNNNRRDRASTEPPISMSSGGDLKGVREPMYDYYGVPYTRSFEAEHFVQSRLTYLWILQSFQISFI